SRRVDEQDLSAAHNGDAHEPGASRLRLAADDGDLLADDGIDQSRFTRVGGADHRDESGARFGIAHFSCFNSASAASVSASCLLVPSAVASPRPGTDTRIVNLGA